MSDFGQPRYSNPDRDDGSPLALIEWNQDQVVQRWTSRAEQVFGWKSEEVAGKRWDEIPLVFDGDTEFVRSIAMELREGTKDHNTSANRNYRKDGSVIHCEWFNSVRRDESGKIIAYVSLVHDVTQRVIADQRADKMRNAMRKIVEGTARDTGDAFYGALVRSLSKALGLRFAMLAIVDPANSTQANSLAFVVDGALRPNFRFPVAGTPCESATHQQFSVCPDEVSQCFPNDPILRDLGARSLLAAPLLDPQGKAFGVLSVFDDKPLDELIDAKEILRVFADRVAVEIRRDETEQARRASDDRLRLLTEQVPAVLWTTDLDLNLTQVTGAAKKHWGAANASVVGRPIAEVLGGSDESRAAIEAHQHANKGKSGSFQIRWSDRVFQGYVEPLRHSDRSIVGTIGVAQDITELDKTQRSLIASEDAFRRLVEHAPEAVVLLDVGTGRFITVNPAAEKLYGLNAEELLKRGPAELSPPTQPDGRRSDEKARELISKACLGETPIFDWMHRNARGEDVPCEIRLLALHDQNGTIVRGSVTDATEKKRAEESLKRLEAELDHVARVSTIGELVGGLAHELNQPLYAIQNYAKACGNVITDGETIDRKQLRSWLSEITASARSAGEILARLRTFVSRKPIDRKPIRLGHLVDSAIMLTQHDARQNHVRIEREIPTTLPLVDADSVQIQQVLVNLLRNAIDATADASCTTPKVKISAQEGDGAVCVTVADNGSGLPEKSHKIFDAFTSTKPQGLGLGLAISKTIVEAHRGRLSAKSRPGGGAEFSFTITLSDPQKVRLQGPKET